MQGLIVLCLATAAVAQSQYSSYPYAPVGYPSYPYNKYTPNYNHYQYNPYNPYINPYTPLVNGYQPDYVAPGTGIQPPVVPPNGAIWMPGLPGLNDYNTIPTAKPIPKPTYTPTQGSTITTTTKYPSVQLDTVIPPSTYPQYNLTSVTVQGQQFVTPPKGPFNQYPPTNGQTPYPQFIPTIRPNPVHQTQVPPKRPVSQNLPNYGQTPTPYPQYPPTIIPIPVQQKPISQNPSNTPYPQYLPTVVPIIVPQKPAPPKIPDVQKPTNIGQTPTPYPQYPPTIIPISVGRPTPTAPAPHPPIQIAQYPVGPANNLPPPIHTQENSNPNLLRCGTPRGQYASDYCNTFINCWDGTAIEQFCPTELVFNPTHGYCDYTYNYVCNKPYKYRETRPVTGIHHPPVSVPYPHPVSVTGSPIVITPPPVTVTSPPHTTGRPPLPAITASPQTPPPQLTPAEYEALKRKCGKPRGQFPTHSCHKYVNCWDAWVSEQECPKGLLFNLAGFCDYPENVHCYNRTVLPVPFSECPTPFGTFRNTTNCNAAFTCSSGLVVSRFECPAGYSFNDNIGVCDFSYRVNCAPSNKDYYSGPPSPLVPNIISPVSTNPIYQPQLDQAWAEGLCLSGKLVRLSHDCSKVALCRNGQPEIVSCNSGLGYDTRTDRCTLLQYSKC